MRPRPSGAFDATLRLGALALAGALAGCASAPTAPASPFELEAFRWRGDAADVAEIVAVNPWGDLRVRTAAHGELVVGAMIQRLGEDDDFAVRVEERAGAIRVEVGGPARARGRVDLTLVVPDGKRLRATTRDGLAEVKYRGDVDVRTRGGDVTLEAEGHARARSASGDIVVKLTGGRWTRPQELRSERGDVTLWLPAGAELALRGGGVHVPPRGAGAPSLRLDSGRGEVRVLTYDRAAAGGSPIRADG